MRTLVVKVDWVTDPPTAPAVANNVNCTKGRQPDRGCAPGRSKGAPVFRYWLKPVVNDLSGGKSTVPDTMDGVDPGSGCGVPMLSGPTTNCPAQCQAQGEIACPNVPDIVERPR